MRVGQGQVNGARSVAHCEGKSGVDASSVEEDEAHICGSVEVRGGLSSFFCGEEPRGVGCGVMDVGVACDQV